MKRLMIALSAMLFVTSCSNVTELPQVTTTNPVVSDTAVIVGGDVTFTGGDNNTSRGVCWSTSPNPTTSDNLKMDASNGAGEFSFDISSLLSPNKTYYFKSFAENKIGKFYGQELSFLSRYGNPNNAFINSNGCVECDNYAVGDTFQMNQKIYIVANRSILLSAFTNGDDLTQLCVSNVTDMSTVFNSTTPFNQDIGAWDVSNVDNMHAMFATSSFNQDIGNWDVSNVTDMSAMFSDAHNFNQDIGNWDVSNVTDMTYMFYFATSFNQDLTQWCVSQFPTLPSHFINQSIFIPSNRPVWGTCT